MKSELDGRINVTGYYSDCIPAYVIVLKREDVEEMLMEEGKRNPITLNLFGKRYSAGLRSAGKKSEVRICSDLVDESGKAVRLSDVLLSKGYISGHKVLINPGKTELTIY